MYFVAAAFVVVVFVLFAFFVYVYTLLIFALHEISFFFVDGLSRSGTARTGVKGRERELAES